MNTNNKIKPIIPRPLLSTTSSKQNIILITTILLITILLITHNKPSILHNKDLVQQHLVKKLNHYRIKSIKGSFIENPQLRNSPQYMKFLHERAKSILQAGSFQPSTKQIRRFQNITTIPYLEWIPTDRQGKEILSKYGTDEAIQECLRNRRIYLLGTSYQRIMFIDLLRILHLPIPAAAVFVSSVENRAVYGKDCELHYPHPRKDWTLHRDAPNIEEVVEEKPCFFARNETICSYTSGLNGFTEDTCGWPSRREFIAGLNTTVVYQFKTYVRTPPLDGIIRKDLKQNGPWDVVYISGGEWGISGKYSSLHFNIGTRTHLDLAHEYFDDVLGDDNPLQANNHFGIVISRCHAGGNRSCRAMCDAAMRESRKILQFYDEVIVGLIERQSAFAKKHGYDGPYSEYFSRGVFATLCSPLPEQL
jgi:hypothetical protein